MFVFTLVQSCTHFSTHNSTHVLFHRILCYCLLLFFLLCFVSCTFVACFNKNIRIRICRHCSERFTRPAQVNRHLLKSHHEGTWLTCHICQKKFSHSGNLKEHVRRHEGVKPYVCCDCSKRFYTAGELKSHQLKHSEFRQFYCSLCGKCYKRKYEVKSHFKRCTEKLGPPTLLF